MATGICTLGTNIGFFYTGAGLDRKAFRLQSHGPGRRLGLPAGTQPGAVDHCAASPDADFIHSGHKHGERRQKNVITRLQCAALIAGGRVLLIFCYHCYTPLKVLTLDLRRFAATWTYVLAV